MLNSSDKLRFEHLVLPHLDAAFNLAFWLVPSCKDAEEVVYEALFVSYRPFLSSQGTAARAFLLQLVHNCAYRRLHQNQTVESISEVQEDLNSAVDPAQPLLTAAIEDRELLVHALELLSPQFRELIVLRELEGCSYQEIAIITSIPRGRVMHALHCARRHLQLTLMRLSRTKPL